MIFKNFFPLSPLPHNHLSVYLQHLSHSVYINKFDVVNFYTNPLQSSSLHTTNFSYLLFACCSLIIQCIIFYNAWIKQNWTYNTHAQSILSFSLVVFFLICFFYLALSNSLFPYVVSSTNFFHSHFRSRL